MYRGDPIGASQLEGRDPSMGVAFGDFEPLPAYESVREVFLLFTEAQEESANRKQPVDEEKLARYSKALETLQRTLQDADGRIIPKTWLYVSDYGDLGRELTVQTSDAAFWGEQTIA
jgi:hypothetical protein